MISPAANAIRQGLVRDALDDTPLTVKRKQWEMSARSERTPPGVKAKKVMIGGVSCLQCEPGKLLSDKVIVYCHGGGLAEGSVDTFRVWTSRLALHIGCRVISVDYRLAPENPFPAAIIDVLAVCEALPVAYGTRTFCIGADSTGCVLALHVMLKLKRTHSAYPDSAFLLSPSVDFTFSNASYEANRDRDPFVSLDVLEHYSKLYAGEQNLADPEVSPLLAYFEDMPPTIVLVDDAEILLDDAKRIVDKILTSGGKASLLLSHGLWHVWPIWGKFPESMSALDSIKQHFLLADSTSI